MRKLLITNDICHETRLHDNILDILFKHKKEISNRLRDIKGLYFIDHVAIIIITPSNEITIFSYTPSVEYNLIIKELWKYDKSFSPYFLKDGSMTWWGEAYSYNYLNLIQFAKEELHKFTLGMNLVRKIENHKLVYSFATRSQKNGIKEFYVDIKDELFHIGDYGYNLIRDIYSEYSDSHVVPFINNSNKILKNKPHLKLIVNNQFDY